MVMKHLVPLMTYSSPSRTAVVRQAPASDPAPASVRAKAPKPPGTTRSAKYLICSGVPASITDFSPRQEAAMVVAKPASYLPSSSRMAATVT